MRIAYICSPYRAEDPADIRRNVNYARELTKLALYQGYAPICPHLYLTQVLDDSNEEERAIGMSAGLDLLDASSVVIVGNRYGISEGMKAEIQRAIDNNKPIDVIAD